MEDELRALALSSINRLLLQPRTLRYTLEIEVVDYVTEKVAAYLPRKLRGTVLRDATSSQMKIMLLVGS